MLNPPLNGVPYLFCTGMIVLAVGAVGYVQPGLGRTPQNSPDNDPRQWRGQTPTEKPVRKDRVIESDLPPLDSTREKFVPGKAEEIPRPSKPGDSKISPEPRGNADENQWREIPVDAHWKTWRRFQPEKRVQLWRALEPDKKKRFWNWINAHEQTDFWRLLTDGEKEENWRNMSNEEREALLPWLPKPDREIWAVDLPSEGKPPFESDGSGKFRPAVPAPGFVPKSLYSEDDPWPLK